MSTPHGLRWLIARRPNPDTKLGERPRVEWSITQRLNGKPIGNPVFGYLNYDHAERSARLTANLPGVTPLSIFTLEEARAAAGFGPRGLRGPR